MSNDYTGCLDNIEDARQLARDSFVYGLKGRKEYMETMQKKSRTYDTVTRRMGDWFRECLQSKTIEGEGRRQAKYISLDCRDYSQNPLYQIWKARTFTPNEIVFFFFMLDYLAGKNEAVRITEVHNEFLKFHKSDVYSENSARKLVKDKICPTGIIIKERTKYRLAPVIDLSALTDMLLYFSEVAPSAVIGSYILDKQDASEELPFRFKQHYVGQAFDSEICCNALFAIRHDRSMSFKYQFSKETEDENTVIPVKVYSSTRNGRQYLIAWNTGNESFFSYRLDKINSIDEISDEAHADAERIKKKFSEMQDHIWGVSLMREELTHVEFEVKVEENEPYIVRRLYREKRCGTVTPVKDRPGIYRFEADVYDAREMFPWIRTFIGRIVDLKISDKELNELFRESFKEMYDQYFEGSEQT